MVSNNPFQPTALHVLQAPTQHTLVVDIVCMMYCGVGIVRVLYLL